MNEAIRTLATSLFNRPAATSVAVVSPNRELQDRLRAAFKKDSRFEFAAILGSLPTVASQFGSGARPSILIADLHEELMQAIEAIGAMRRSGYDGSIIALSDMLDEPSIRGLLRLNVIDWLPANAEPADVVAACDKAVETRKVRQRAGQAKCVAFLPAAGGVGTTTLAIQAGFLLAEHDRNFQGTCLVDLDLQSGTLADYIDLKPNLDLKTIADEPDRLDSQLLEVMLARHPTGLAVLAAPRTMADSVCADGVVVTRVLGVVSDMFQHMVIDLPAAWHPWTMDVLGGSDHIFIVTDFLVPALRKAQELRAELLSRLSNDAKVQIIVNKFRQPLLGGGLRRSDAVQLLGDGLAGFISDESELVREAINRGEPLGLHARANRVTRELSRLIVQSS